MWVLNIRLKLRGSVSSPPHSPGRLLGRSGQLASSSWSARKRSLHFLQSTIGSVKFGDVAGGLPDARVHQDRAVEAHDVVAAS